MSSVEIWSRNLILVSAPFLMSMVIANFAIAIVLNTVTQSRPAFEGLYAGEERSRRSLQVRPPP